MVEERVIEKKGIIKLSSADRKALTVLVWTDLLQKPVSEYLNVKTNPNKSHYGYANIMFGEYVVKTIQLEYRRQIILDIRQFDVQLGWQEYCNAKEILTAVAGTISDRKVKFPSLNITEIRFKLESGVILNVSKETQPIVGCGGDGVEQTDNTPPTPKVPGEPPNPPAIGSPPNNTPDLSPPYEGNDDNGNTYVPSGKLVYTKYWLVGTFLTGNNTYATQSTEPSDSSAFILVQGNDTTKTLQAGTYAGNGPDGQAVFFYKLSTNQSFNGAWKATPSLGKRVLTQ